MEHLEAANKEIQEHMGKLARELITLKEHLVQLEKGRDFVNNLHDRLIDISLFVGMMEGNIYNHILLCIHIYYTCIILGRVDVAYGVSNKRRINESNLSSAIQELIDFIFTSGNLKLATAFVDREILDELKTNSTGLLAIL